MIGEIVYFAPVTNGRASIEYSVRDGATTGVLNPQAKTDRQGHFRIEVRKDQVPTGSKFTLGNWQGWFVRDTGALGVFDIPARPAKESKTLVNVGSVVR